LNLRGQAARKWAEQNLSMARFRTELEQTVVQLVQGRAPQRSPQDELVLEQASVSLGQDRRLNNSVSIKTRRPLRILHYTAYYAPAWCFGGPPRSVSALCEALAEQGHEVTVFTTNGGLAGQAEIPTDHCVVRNGVTVHYFPAEFNWMGLKSPQLEKAVAERASEFDLLHVTGVWQPTSPAACRAARGAGKPYISSPRGALGWYSLKHRAWKKFPYYWLWERSNLRKSAALHFTSSMEAEECRKLGLRSPGYIVPNCIDVQIWNRDEEGGRAWRRRHKIGAQEFVLLYAGRFHHKKGLDFLPEVCAKLESNLDWKLVLVGFEADGSGGILTSKFRQMGKSDRLIIAQGVGTHELPAIYSGADVFVFPSRHENFGNVAIEALSCGCPVVMSDQVGVSDQVTDLPGVTVVPLDVKAWGAGLSEVMKRRDKRDPELIRAGVVEKFSRSQIAAEMEEVYFEVLEAMR